MKDIRPNARRNTAYQRAVGRASLGDGVGQLVAPFNTEGERHVGEGPFAYVELTRLWHLVRSGGCLSAMAIGVGFIVGGLPSQGIAVAVGGLLALVDTRYRIRNPKAALWPALVIDAALIAIAAPVAGLPPASLLAAFAYLGTAALFFLETRTAMMLLAAMGGCMLASVQFGSMMGLDHTQVTTAGSVIGATTWTLFLFGIVWTATRAINSFHTEREVARRRLESLLQAKDEFVATVSHELRTPLTAVLGLAQQLVELVDSLSVDERDEFTALVASEAGEAAAIVEDLLVAARIGDGRVAVHPTRLDLDAEVANVLGALARGSEVDHQPSAEGTAYADPIRVRQIIRNLVTNAERYGGPLVSITTGPGQLVVRDDGPGIPTEDSARVFEPYGRSDSQDHDLRSVGLGLAVSRSLARLMGGDLSYQRTDRQSTFVLDLPLESPSAEVSQTGLASSQPAG